MRDILWLVKNSLKVTFRKKSNIIFYVLLPIVGIIIALMAYGGSNESISKIGIANNDNNYISRDTVTYLKSLDNFNVSITGASEVNNSITSKKLDCVVVINSGFSESVYSGKPENIQIISIKGKQSTAYIKYYLYNYIDNIAAIGSAAHGNKDIFYKMYNGYHKDSLKLHVNSVKDNSKYKNITNYAVGFLLMIILMSATNLAEIILKEKENRTYFRIFSSPISSKKYIFANIIVNFLVITGEIILTLILLEYVFHIDMGVSFFKMFFILILFVPVGIGFAELSVSFSNNSASVSAMQNLIITPTCLISGCFFPVEYMPKYFQRISDFMPQRWVLSSISSLQKGNSIYSIYLNIAIILAFAAAFFLISMYKFSRNKDLRDFS